MQHKPFQLLPNRRIQYRVYGVWPHCLFGLLNGFVKIQLTFFVKLSEGAS